MPNKRNISRTQPGFGQSRSKAFNTSKRTFKPNMQNKRIFVPELGCWVRVQLTAGELRTVSKIGLADSLEHLAQPTVQPWLILEEA